MSGDGPAVIDAGVASDELPNLPPLALALIGHYAQAKGRQAILAVARA